MRAGGGGMHLLLLLWLPALSGGAGGTAGGAGGPAGGPVFVPGQQTVVRAVEGGSAILRCRVLHLGDKAVSWVRARDLQILSHGGAVFTADARVSVPPAPPPAPPAPAPPPPAHALRIDRLRGSDAGRYECQLNTEPKMSLFFDLMVTDEPEAATTTDPAPPEEGEGGEVSVWAVGGGRVAVRAGGAAELACAARGPHRPGGAAPLDLRWLREGQPLVLQEGWSERREAGRGGAESRVRVWGARAQDAGRYSCVVGRAAATLLLEVLDDDTHESMGEMEAMQRDQSAGGTGGAGGAGGAARAPGGTARAALALTIVAFLAV